MARYYVRPSTGNNGNNGLSAGTAWATLAYAASQVHTMGDVIDYDGSSTVSSRIDFDEGVSLEGVSNTTSEIIGTDSSDFILAFESGSQNTFGNQHITNLKLDGDSLSGYGGILVGYRGYVEVSSCVLDDFEYYGVSFRNGEPPSVYAKNNKFNYNVVTNCSGYHGGAQGCLEIQGQETMEIAYNNLDADRGGLNSGNCIYGVEGFIKDIKIHHNTFTKNFYDGVSSWDFAIEFWNCMGGIEINDNTIIGSIDLTRIQTKGIYPYSVWIHDNDIGQPALNTHEGIRGVLLEYQANDVIIERNRIHHVTQGIYFQQANGVRLVENIRIDSNLFEEIGSEVNKGWGIYFSIEDRNDIVNNIQIWNNTFIASQDVTTTYGIGLPDIGTATNISIKNNIIQGFGGAAIYGSGTGGVTITGVDIQNNLFNDNGVNGVSTVNGLSTAGWIVLNNIVLAPQFVGGGNYALQDTSPARGTGLNVGLSLDRVGNIWNIIPSIGCYEYGSIGAGTLVTSIALSPNAGITITTDDGTIQFTATIEPTNATIKTVTWSVINGTGTAVISSTGLLTALTDGTVTVKATAKDASGQYATAVVTISNQLVNAAKRLVPVGWHIPTKLEWDTIVADLGGTNIAGGSLKEAGTTHWTTPNTGATNATGFTGLPTGIRQSAGTFVGEGNQALYWSSDEATPNDAFVGELLYDDALFSVYYVDKNYGCSIRPVKDDSVNPGSMTDIDGNVYPTIQIGNIVIFAEDLRVTRFTDGTPIPNITDNTAWSNLTESAMCFYNNAFTLPDTGGGGSPAMTEGSLYYGTQDPTGTLRLNYDGYFYATKIFSGGVEVGTGGGESDVYVDSIIKEQVVYTGITITEDFENYTEGQLIGQGEWYGGGLAWEVIDDSVLGKVIGPIGSGSTSYAQIELANLVELAGFDISFEIAALPENGYLKVYIGNTAYIDIYYSGAGDAAYFYVYTVDDYGELYTSSNYQPGDVIMIRRRGLNITMYRNGVIDTSWYDYNYGSYDLTGADGEFVLKSPFNWDSSADLWFTAPTDPTVRIDNLTIHYNISETALGTGVHLVNDKNSPGNNQYYGTDVSGTKGWYALGEVSELIPNNNILEWDSVGNYYRPYSTLTIESPIVDNFESYSAGNLSGQGNWTFLQDGANRMVVADFNGDMGVYDSHIDGNDPNYFYIADNTIGSNHFAEVTIAFAATDDILNNHFGVMVRAFEDSSHFGCFYFTMDSNSYYYIGYYYDGIDSRIIANSLSSTPIVDGTVMRMEVVGNELRVYYNGAPWTGWNNEIPDGVIDISSYTDIPIGGMPGIFSLFEDAPATDDARVKAGSYSYGNTGSSDSIFYGGTVNPEGNTRLNYNGNFYATKLFSDELKVGGENNAVKISHGGVMTFEGAATVWDDLRVAAESISVGGANIPALVSYQPTGSGATTKLREFAKGDIGYFTTQIPHGYKVGSDIYVHIHWTPRDYGAAQSGNSVGWKVLYSIAAINESFPAMSTADLSDICDGANDKHHMTSQVAITGTDFGISSIIMGQVTRTDTGLDDTWSETVTGRLPLLLGVDFHIEMDTVGSKSNTGK
jgi:uncharacterized protein (TIGR02145 family)